MSANHLPSGDHCGACMFAVVWSGTRVDSPVATLRMRSDYALPSSVRWATRDRTDDTVGDQQLAFEWVNGDVA